MMTRLVALAVALVILVGGAGYLIGIVLQAPAELAAVFSRGTDASQSAPLPLSPAHDSVFIDSDIRLRWAWPPGLGERQIFTVRLWADDLPHQEIWTEASDIGVKQTIDGFSIDFGQFYWQVAALNLDAQGAYESMASEWSEVTQMQRLRRPPIPMLPADEMSATARQFAERELPATELIVAVHRFVHDNSKTNEQLSYAPDYSDAVELMYWHAQGESSDMPRLLCDGRSTAMLTILRELGIESRLVFLYASKPGWLNRHTVLEVFNPDTQRWQTHDVGTDFFYVEANTGKRVSAERILFGAHDDLAGCPIAGGECGAEVLKASIGYFGAMRYGYTYEVWVNPDRFDLSARFEGQDNQNLAEYVGDGDPRRVTFVLDSWKARS